ncbi:MAG: TlpA family protein disulfide reductase [Chromatiales bacterium]
MLKKTLGIGVILMALLGVVRLVGGLGNDTDPSSGPTAPVDTTASLFAATFRDLQWQPQAMKQWEGRYLVVYFWATWCKPCRHEVPELIALYKDENFHESGAEIVGIAIDNADSVAAFAKEYGITYPLLVGGDDAMAVSKQLGNHIGGLPFTVVIDPQGRVVQTLLGETKEGTLRGLLQSLLERSPSA